MSLDLIRQYEDRVNKARELLKSHQWAYEELKKLIRGEKYQQNISIKVGGLSIPLNHELGYCHKSKRGSEMVALGLLKMLDEQIDDAKAEYQRCCRVMSEYLIELAESIDGGE